jgi:hypothetical protein
MAKSITKLKQGSHNGGKRTARLLLALLIAFALHSGSVGISGQTSQRSKSQSSHLREAMSPATRELVERAIDVVCLERQKDPQGSIPIDDMQRRPSLPLRSPEAIAGAERAQRLLPLARALVIRAISDVAARYGFRQTRGASWRLRAAIARVQAVKRVKPDMEARDNASVFLKTPHTITFGTIFLAGLASDEAMISVLAHELTHIADGNEGSLQILFQTIGGRASRLTALSVRGQRAEELACDLVGAIASRTLVSRTPNYEPLARRIARSVAHNCVDEDEGDEDHLSPRNTIRALLALEPALARELVYGREEKNTVRD